MADPEHLASIGSVVLWNLDRPERPDLSGADLSGANLKGADLSRADLSRANLSGANLRWADLRLAKLDRADLRRANLSRANLKGADLSRANLYRANLKGADLSGANLKGVDLSRAHLRWADLRLAKLDRADLRRANLSRANLIGVDLSRANLYRTNFIGADLSRASLKRANLTRADLVKADLSGADLAGVNLTGADLVETRLEGVKLDQARVCGVSVWNTVGTPASQRDLVITARGDAEVTVDNLKVAQFIHLLMNNEEIRDVVDTITSKAVLILGRFTLKRKAILDLVRTELREKYNYTPIVFDFQKPETKNLTDTVRLLANMARFVIVDLSDATSANYELGVLTQLNLRTTPFVIMVEADLPTMAMLPDVLSYQEVISEVHEYTDAADLSGSLVEAVIQPAEGLWSQLNP